MSEPIQKRQAKPAGPISANQLNFHQLYIFQTVASHLSFSRAAEALEITQPAVSIQVHELEKSLGVTLFHRRSRGLGVTEMGEAVLAYSQQIFSLSNNLLETIQEMQDLQAGHLTLGASTTPGEFVLPLAVGQFRQIYPNVQVELVIGKTRSIIQRILDHEIDIGMVGDHVTGFTAELEMIDYMEDVIVLVASPEHPAAQRPTVSLQEVAESGLVIREQGSATRLAAERHFAELGVVPEIAIELGSNQAVKQAAVAGGGIGVVSRLGIAAEVKAGMLTELAVEGWDCRRPLTLVHPKDRYLSPSQRAFREFLITHRPTPAFSA
jgi:DNA-binding transcriptional LysR family regulator